MANRRQILHEIQADRSIPGGREVHLTYRAEGDHAVPAILLLPDSTKPARAAVLVHGYSSRKEDVSGPMGQALLRRGIASLAVDLPMHGSRRTGPDGGLRETGQIVSLWKQALRDITLGFHYLRARREVDRERVALVGYSIGSYLSTVIAGQQRNVRALVVAAGGDLPSNLPLGPLARLFADPLGGVRKLEGRPLLVIHGRYDRTVLPDQAQRLFDAASEPKQLIWYEAGHRLPRAAAVDAAEWLDGKL